MDWLTAWYILTTVASLIVCAEVAVVWPIFLHLYRRGGYRQLLRRLDAFLLEEESEAQRLLRGRP